MDVLPKHTLVLSSQDIHEIVATVGLDKLMNTLIKRLTSAMKNFDGKQTVIPIRSGFNYHQPHTGLVEWMPLYVRGSQVVLKLVGYHPKNPQLYGLPTILSTISAYDSRTGHLAGLMDGVLSTALRTGAASAVASRLLAAPESSTLGLIGCGAQAVTQLHALSCLFDIRKVIYYDVDVPTMLSFSERCSVLNLNIDFVPSSIEELVPQADILCTATSIEVGEGPLFDDLDTKEHLHINAVGADFPGKFELPMSLIRQSFMCPDFTEQALLEGECQRLTTDQIEADIIEVMTQENKYRQYQHKRTIYDSTGWALQDNVILELLMEYADHLGIGQQIEVEYMPQDAKNPYQFAQQSISEITSNQSLDSSQK